MMVSKKTNRILTQLFLLAFTLAVLFPVAKVFQIAFQDKQTFDTSLLPLPRVEHLSLKNFSDVLGRSKVEGLGPELNQAEIEILGNFLATVPWPKPEEEDHDDAEEEEWEVPDQDFPPIPRDQPRRVDGRPSSLWIA